MIPIIRLPRSMQQSLESTARALLQPPGGRRIDFTRPAGEEALVAHDSTSWRIFKNPIALLVGGMAAVVLELAEPAVRTGVWKHSTFLADPMGRLRRTGLAAMVTVYGARSMAVPMIEGVVRMHGRVVGKTPAGEPFSANDPRLLTWVHATASFGFGEAYSRYVALLNSREMDALYREGLPASRLYGAVGAPETEAELRALFDSMRGTLEPSEIVFEFLRIMYRTRALPAPLRWLQPLLVRAAVDLIPDWIRACIGLTAAHGLRPGEGILVRMAGAVADRIVLPDSPPSQACHRLGLPKAYLFAPKPRLCR
ncbi:MAG TPA: oxygenase MpaB family protein [Steroidobacteraceae bacterium]|nr:oxygenase MpaB family protein [Steroidobacteraceae bacterium]